MRPANVWRNAAEVDCDDLSEPGEEEREDGLMSWRIGSKLGWMSSPGFGTDEVRSIHSGRMSHLLSDCTRLSSSVLETVM